MCLLCGPNTCSYLASLKIHAVMHCDHDNCHHPKIIILAIVSLIFKCPLITMRPCLLGSEEGLPSQVAIAAFHNLLGLSECLMDVFVQAFDLAMDITLPGRCTIALELRS